jgi:DNA-binding MarR family transcriptional regulator
MSHAPDFEKISNYHTPEESPGYLLWRVSTQWRSTIEKTLKLYGITHPQFVVLATIGRLSRKSGGITQVEVSRATGLDVNTISQVVRGLEAKKLIKRVQKIDERSKNPLLTELGSEILTKTLPAVEKADAEFFAVLAMEETEKVVALFQKLLSLNRRASS